MPNTSPLLLALWFIIRHDFVNSFWNFTLIRGWTEQLPVFVYNIAGKVKRTTLSPRGNRCGASGNPQDLTVSLMRKAARTLTGIGRVKRPRGRPQAAMDGFAKPDQKGWAMPP